MKRLSILIALAMLLALPAVAKSAPRADGFASDFQMVPVMGNLPGAGSVFQTYVALLNPTSSSFPVTVTLYDPNGAKREAVINLAAGELKTYENFLDAVFQYTGGGAVTFLASESAGGTHNHRFIVSVEVRTSGTRYSTPVPTVDFAPSSSRSFAPGIAVNTATRTNIGCFNQSDAANTVTADVYDLTGTQKVGTVTLNLAANAWGQAPVSDVVANGYVRFTPTEAAACYAVVVDNATGDGRLIPAIEYQP